MHLARIWVIKKNNLIFLFFLHPLAIRVLEYSRDPQRRGPEVQGAREDMLAVRATQPHRQPRSLAIRVLSWSSAGLQWRVMGRGRGFFRWIFLPVGRLGADGVVAAVMT